MDYVRSSCPLRLGLQRQYNGYYSQKQYREVEQIYKSSLSSDCSLKLDYMKLELLVMANQKVAVNMSLFLALTARQSMGVDAL